jgi:hypothetical protein
MKSSRGRTVVLAILLTAAVFPCLALAEAPLTNHGVELPPLSQQVGQDRYRITLKFFEAIKYFHLSYKGLLQEKWIIRQPGIRAIHLVNTGPGDWDGVNIYEKDDEVRVYILARATPPKKERRKEK